MSGPTSSQGLRVVALKQAVEVWGNRGYDVETVVQAADVMARFLINNEVPDKPDTPPAPAST